MEESNKEILLKEIDTIQSIINRVASNSFLIKGWTITLVVGILLLENITTARIQITIAFVPLILFWLLDSYFLYQERLYRKLYEWVAENRLKNKDHLLSMKTDRFKKDISEYKVPFSRTLFLFYGGIFLSIVLYGIFIYCTS
jgi:hypothetical protein